MMHTEPSTLETTIATHNYLEAWLYEELIGGFFDRDVEAMRHIHKTIRAAFVRGNELRAMRPPSVFAENALLK